MLPALLLVCCYHSFYVEPNAATVGYQSPAPNRDSFKLGFPGLQQCLDACDDSSW